MVSRHVQVYGIPIPTHPHTPPHTQHTHPHTHNAHTQHTHTHRDRDSKDPIDARSGKITEFTIKGFERYTCTTIIIITYILYHLFLYSFFRNVVASDDYIGRAFLPLSDITQNGEEKVLKLQSHSGRHDDRGMLHVLLNIQSEQRSLRNYDVSSKSLIAII